jgi:hypothetical protein
MKTDFSPFYRGFSERTQAVTAARRGQISQAEELPEGKGTAQDRGD